MKIKLIIFFLLLHTICFSQVIRKYSNAFLDIGVGARAQGMSGAVASSTTDISASYWNPAGLADMTGNMQIGLMHAELFAGISKYDYAGIGAKIDNKSNAAFSMIRFGVDGIPNTIELEDANGNINYDRIKSFSVADYAFVFSYARKLANEHLRVGGNFKIIRRTIGEFGQAWGFGLDASAIYKLQHFTFSATLKDFPSTFNAWSYNIDAKTRDVFTRTGNVIPDNSLEVTLPKLTTAIAYQRSLGKNYGILTEVDGDVFFDGARNVLISYKVSPVSFDPHIGLEINRKQVLFFRAGIGNFQRILDENGKKKLILQPNMGVGLKIKNLYLDYALASIINAASGTESDSSPLYGNIFSLRLDIFRKEKAAK